MGSPSLLTAAITHEAGHVAVALAAGWRPIRAEADDTGRGCTEVIPPDDLHSIPGFATVWGVADADEQRIRPALAAMERAIRELRLVDGVSPALLVAVEATFGFLMAGGLAEGIEHLPPQPMHGDGSKAAWIATAFGIPTTSLSAWSATTRRIAGGPAGQRIRAAFRIHPDGRHAAWTPS